MPTPNTADAMKRHKAGKAGFTDKAHLKAKGLIPRADGTKKKSPKYEDMDRQPQDKDVKKVKGTQPKKYYKTLDKDTKTKRANFFKNRPKQKKSDDDDDYRPAPGDKGAKTKTSTHTKKYKQMYGEAILTKEGVIPNTQSEKQKLYDKYIKMGKHPDAAAELVAAAVSEDAPANATGTAVAGTGDDSSTIVMKKKKDKETMKDRLLRRFKIKETIDRTVPDLERPKDDIKEKAKMMKSMALKANVNIDEAIKGLQNKAKKTGMPYSILKKVYDRGMAAWKGGHRPGTTQQQWAFARVNSFVTKSSGTWGKADKDLADKVRASKG